MSTTTETNVQSTETQKVEFDFSNVIFEFIGKVRYDFHGLPDNTIKSIIESTENNEYTNIDSKAKCVLLLSSGEEYVLTNNKLVMLYYCNTIKNNFSDIHGSINNIIESEEDTTLYFNIPDPVITSRVIDTICEFCFHIHNNPSVANNDMFKIKQIDMPNEENQKARKELFLRSFYTNLYKRIIETDKETNRNQFLWQLIRAVDFLECTQFQEMLCCLNAICRTSAGIIEDLRESRIVEVDLYDEYAALFHSDEVDDMMVASPRPNSDVVVATNESESESEQNQVVDNKPVQKPNTNTFLLDTILSTNSRYAIYHNLSIVFLIYYNVWLSHRYFDLSQNTESVREDDKKLDNLKSQTTNSTPALTSTSTSTTTTSTTTSTPTSTSTSASTTSTTVQENDEEDEEVEEVEENEDDEENDEEID